MLRYLTVEAVLAIHEQVLAAHGGGTGIRDRALLESAVAAPQASFGGEAMFDDPLDIAAAYLFYLCRNHPFVDGNKRVALASCLVFLQTNNELTDLDLPGRDIDAWESFIIDLASARIDREQTAQRLRELLAQARS
ncbi:MAG TPA: Fic family protein [Burkholderiales bacterium]|jgi:death-on-curing protein|nr:Fic family protein [Burkholderiales bacterium]